MEWPPRCEVPYSFVVFLRLFGKLMMFGVVVCLISSSRLPVIFLPAPALVLAYTWGSMFAGGSCNFSE